MKMTLCVNAPFKWQYEYYTQHRLIKEFEANILGDLAIVSADEIIEYYTSHLNDYTPSGQINFAILWDEDDLADKIIIDFSRGEDFFSVARKYYHQEIPIQSTSEHTLDPEIAPILAELTSGEVSDLVKFKGKMCFIKMINKKLPSPAPLVDIKEEITKKLHQDKLSQQRSSYINTLREKSKIKINEALWLSLRKEFIGDSRESNVN
ncbi:MAG: hypothetical protein KKE17_04400 [Proteobacteria bacterium]|nr:hypothetical protein [Pseudomonadota bacterium]